MTDLERARELERLTGAYGDSVLRLRHACATKRWRTKRRTARLWANRLSPALPVKPRKKEAANSRSPFLPLRQSYAPASASASATCWKPSAMRGPGRLMRSSVRA